LCHSTAKDKASSKIATGNADSARLGVVRLKASKARSEDKCSGDEQTEVSDGMDAG